MNSKHNNYWDRKNWIPLENRVELPKINWSETLEQFPREIHHMSIPMDSLMNRVPFDLKTLADKTEKGWRVVVDNYPINLEFDTLVLGGLSEPMGWIQNGWFSYIGTCQEFDFGNFLRAQEKQRVPIVGMDVSKGITRWPIPRFNAWKDRNPIDLSKLYLDLEMDIGNREPFRLPFFHQNKEGTEGIGITAGQGDVGWSRPFSRHSTVGFHEFLEKIPMGELLEVLQEVGDFCLNKRFRGMVRYQSKHLDTLQDLYEDDLPKIIQEVRRRHALKESDEDDIRG